MLIHQELPQGSIYPQITQAPINNYADFVNFFRGGHTIDDNLGTTVIAATLQAKMLEIAIKSRHLTKTRGAANPYRRPRTRSRRYERSSRSAQFTFRLRLEFARQSRGNAFYR